MAIKKAALIVATPESTRKEARKFHPTIESIYRMAAMKMSPEKIALSLDMPVSLVLSRLQIVEDRMMSLAAESLDKQVGEMCAQIDTVISHSYEEYLQDPNPAHLAVILKATDTKAKHLAVSKRMEGKIGTGASTIQSLLQELADRNDSDLTALWSTEEEPVDEKDK